jgi:hypothetical protein
MSQEFEIFVDATFLLHKGLEKFQEIVAFGTCPQMNGYVVTVRRWGEISKAAMPVANEPMLLPTDGRILVESRYFKEFTEFSALVALAKKFEQGYKLHRLYEGRNHYTQDGRPKLFSRDDFVGHYTSGQRSDIAGKCLKALFKRASRSDMKGLADFLATEWGDPDKDKIGVDHGPGWGNWGALAE